jgi:hypothetical protein
MMEALPLCGFLVASSPPSLEGCQKGSELYSAGKWSDAEQAFLGAWAIQKTYDIAANLGHAEHKLGKWRDAAEHLGFALRNWPLAGKPEPKELARQRFEEVRAKVGGVSIEVSVAGAEVVIDRKPMGTSPLPAEVYVEPGSHRVEAKLQGYMTASSAVQATAGGTHAVKLMLMRDETDKPNGSEGTARMALLIGGAAASAVGIGMGIGFTVAANGKSADAAALRDQLVQETPADVAICAEPTGKRGPTCAEIRGKLADRETFTDVARGSFIAGGVLALATVGYAILTRTGSEKTTRATSVHVAPMVGRSSGGVLVVGAW